MNTKNLPNKKKKIWRFSTVLYSCTGTVLQLHTSELEWKHNVTCAAQQHSLFPTVLSQF